MYLQRGEHTGNTVLIWLSKKECDDSIIQDIIKDIKKKYRVCVYRSGTIPYEELYKKLVMENLDKP